MPGATVPPDTLPLHASPQIVCIQWQAGSDLVGGYGQLGHLFWKWASNKKKSFDIQHLIQIKELAAHGINS